MSPTQSNVTPGYDSELRFVVDLVKTAGQLIITASDQRSTGKGSKVNDKKNRVDLVTETDQAVEKLISESLSKKFPTHKFIGEESFSAGSRAELTDEPTWICDPIDGTTNFVHGFPHVCISIGFVIKKIPTIGVIYNPFLSQLYTAVRGRGAYLNESRRLPLSYPNDHLPLKDLKDALIAVEWGSDRSKEVLDLKSKSFLRLVGDPDRGVQGGVMCHSLRSIGSAALNYTLVASGTLDIYWEIGCWAWDVCAGMVIAIESGCKCYGRGGKPIRFEDGKDLMGHHFFVIRGISNDDLKDQKDSQASINYGDGDERVIVVDENTQDELARKFFDEVVEEWDA